MEWVDFIIIYIGLGGLILEIFCPGEGIQRTMSKFLSLSIQGTKPKSKPNSYQKNVSLIRILEVVYWALHGK